MGVSRILVAYTVMLQEIFDEIQRQYGDDIVSVSTKGVEPE